MIFNDAVMHQSNGGSLLARARKMWVGVARDGGTMRGPTRVRNAREPSDVLTGNRVGQFSHPLGAAGASQAAIVKHRNTARIIATILKTT